MFTPFLSDGTREEWRARRATTELGRLRDLARQVPALDGMSPLGLPDTAHDKVLAICRKTNDAECWCMRSGIADLGQPKCRVLYGGWADRDAIAEGDTWDDVLTILEAS